MEIRECLSSDYKDIYQLNKKAFGYEYDIEKTKSRLNEIINRETDKIYVASIDNKVVGYIHGSDYECTYSDPLKNIMAIAVDEDYRGKGIGRTLLNAIENWAKESDCSGVRLVSGFNRVEAHRFYLHCGYNDRKDQKNFIKYFNRCN
ncbi:MAG TPA: GNAT family N-acetyltransferase [Clostridiales bacterium]|nr:GNAT family N-acetyltransferase [Clostridiales bacterium]